MNSLNTEQKKAVDLINGRILILAGAGCGKTKVLTYRIANLITNKGINEGNILALTFTNKAAKEMRVRLSKLIGNSKSKKVTLSTFHSFAMLLLRKEAEKIGYSSNFSIYDDLDMQRFYKSLISDYIQNDKVISVNSIIEKISNAKNLNLSIDEIPLFEEKDKNEIFLSVYKQINHSLKAYNAMNFDTLLSSLVELFEKNADVLKKYQNKYKYILIDEYQDTNPIQYKIADLLSKNHNNLFVVGDDDQAIYSFRGSCIKHILNFKADHIVKLEQNYRSTNIILDAANSVIKNNKTRHDKVLFSKNISDEQIKLFHAPTEVEEAQSVINRAIDLKQNYNLNWNDIAVLYRSNSLSRNIEMHLIQAMWKKDGSWVRGIPYDIYGGLSFAQRAEIKDILSYLKVICNETDLESLFRIINVPRRGISDKTIELIKNYKKDKKLSFYKVLKLIKENKIDLSKEKISFQPRSLRGIESFVTLIEEAKMKFSKGSLHTTLKWFINKIDYKKAIAEEIKSEKARLIKWENVNECINALSTYEEEEKNPSLNHFISSTMLDKDNLYKPDKTSTNKLQLMTLHSSKGLEFKACFIIGLEDSIIPHEKCMTNIDEERRLFYVGLTRAKKYLILSMARNRKRVGKNVPTNPSRFLFEIPKELLKICSWKKI
ncbi:MAG: ATP-dependent DNA helicase PcrA [Candidatus Anoxychlamydiales bacterium]|nr:ATP-dependent DNA helicase PcrA [Candidatus Anoxychlamydiales bacterium]